MNSNNNSKNYIADIQEGVYSADKISYHPDRINTLKNNSITIPIAVRISISDLCNHDCSFCSFRMENNINNELFPTNKNNKRQNNPNRMIETKKIKEIIEDISHMGGKSIEFTGGGEPTTHPDHISIFKHSLNLGLEASLITNGELIKEEHHLILSRFSWVRFSIDASQAETWGAIRRKPKKIFSSILNNARSLIKYRNDKKSETLISAGFVICQENWKEIYNAVKLFKEVGFDAVRISAVYNSTEISDHFNDFITDASKLCAKAKFDFDDSNFHVANNFDSRLNDLIYGSHPKYKRCWYQEVAPYIGGDLNVYRCCNTAYTSTGLLGSLYKKQFSKLWNEIYKKSLFKNFQANQECSLCMFNNRNQVIKGLVDEKLPIKNSSKKPMHVNFI